MLLRAATHPYIEAQGKALETDTIVGKYGYSLLRTHELDVVGKSPAGNPMRMPSKACGIERKPVMWQSTGVSLVVHERGD